MQVTLVMEDVQAVAIVNMLGELPTKAGANDLYINLGGQIKYQQEKAQRPQPAPQPAPLPAQAEATEAVRQQS